MQKLWQLYRDWSSKRVPILYKCMRQWAAGKNGLVWTPFPAFRSPTWCRHLMSQSDSWWDLVVFVLALILRGQYCFQQKSYLLRLLTKEMLRKTRVQILCFFQPFFVRLLLTQRLEQSCASSRWTDTDDWDNWLINRVLHLIARGFKNIQLLLQVHASELRVWKARLCTFQCSIMLRESTDLRPVGSSYKIGQGFRNNTARMRSELL